MIYAEMIEVLKMRDATPEERKSVDDYVESISVKVNTFTDEELAEHDKQIKSEAIGKFATELLNIFSNNCDFYETKEAEMIEAIEIEKIDSLIYNHLKKLKEKNK